MHLLGSRPRAGHMTLDHGILVRIQASPPSIPSPKAPLNLLVWSPAGLSLLLPLRAQAQQAIDFTLNDLAGRSQTLSEIYPKGPVLLNFWATWCLPCAKEFPHLQRLHDHYRETGFQALAISVDGPDRLAKVSSFVGRDGYTFPRLLDTEPQ